MSPRWRQREDRAIGGRQNSGTQARADWVMVMLMVGVVEVVGVVGVVVTAEVVMVVVVR